MARLKNGLLLWSNAQKEMSEKSFQLFSGIHDIALLLPDDEFAVVQVHHYRHSYSYSIKNTVKDFLTSM
jgi:hypothetical protein